MGFPDITEKFAEGLRRKNRSSAGEAKVKVRKSKKSWSFPSEMKPASPVHDCTIHHITQNIIILRFICLSVYRSLYGLYTI